MKKLLFPATIAVALGFALACGGSTSAPPPPPSTPAAAGGSVGVPECDDYIKKMESCIGSMDPTMKSQYESAFKSTRDAWAQAAATPQGKEDLKIGCQSALSSIPPTCSGGSTAAAPAGAAPAGAAAPAGTTATTGATPATTTTATTAPAATPAATPEATPAPQGDFKTNKKSPSLEEMRNNRH